MKYTSRLGCLDAGKLIKIHMVHKLSHTHTHKQLGTTTEISLSETVLFV